MVDGLAGPATGNWIVEGKIGAGVGAVEGVGAGGDVVGGPSAFAGSPTRISSIPLARSSAASSNGVGAGFVGSIGGGVSAWVIDEGAGLVGSIDDISEGGSIATVAGSNAARPAEASVDCGLLGVAGRRPSGIAWQPPRRATIVRTANPAEARRVRLPSVMGASLQVGMKDGNRREELPHPARSGKLKHTGFKIP